MAAAVLVLTAGCGSTVGQRDVAVAENAGEVEQFGGTVDTAGQGAQPPADRASVAGALSAPARRTASSVGGAVNSARPAPTSGRGFNAKELFIGYNTWKDVSRFGTTVGVEGAEPFDQEAVARAVVDDINGRGGIAGRRVVLVFYDYQTADLPNPTVADQKACTLFTEDRPVFAVVAAVGPVTDLLPECLAKAGVPLIANDNIPRPQAMFERLAAYLYSTASPTMEHFVRAVLPRAVANGYLGKWDVVRGDAGAAPVKVGLLVSDSPAGELFVKLVTAELARRGVTAYTTFAANPLDASQMQAAVLRFNGEGVTHVIPEALNLLLFPQAAESQRYRPRYLVSTAQALLLVQGTAPPAQLKGALGAGYFPSYDVDNAHDPGEVSPYESHCKEAQRRGGTNPNQRNAFNAMGKACDGFRFLEVAITKGGLSTDGIRRAVPLLSFIEPAGAFSISFSGGRLDGAAAVRDIGYDVGDRAFYYLSRTNHPM